MHTEIFKIYKKIGLRNDSEHSKIIDGPFIGELDNKE